MRHYKIIDGVYIIGIGTGGGGVEISEAEYNEIMSIIRNRPEESDTIGYRLKTDLTWEACEKPAPDPDPDATDGDILEAIGGAL